MCKFHKDVAKDIATDAKTGAFDPGRYAVALVAMAHFRVEQYMPAMYGVDGFVPAQLVTETAVKALASSGLRDSLPAIRQYHDNHIGAIRAAMDRTAAAFRLAPRDLNISPGEITKDGYKATCCAKPDPAVNGPFLDYAVVNLFEGYDDGAKTRATGTLFLIEAAPKPQYEAIRMAAAHFIAQPGVLATLQQLFEDTMVGVFKSASADLAAGRGFAQTQGCVMCHDDERRHAGDEPAPRR